MYSTIYLLNIMISFTGPDTKVGLSLPLILLEGLISFGSAAEPSYEGMETVDSLWKIAM